MSRKLYKALSISDLREQARSKIPSPMFHYIDGGADDEVTMRRNESIFDNYLFNPRVLTDVSTIDMSTAVLGSELKLPFFLSPTGMSRLFHHEKEGAVARAANNFGTLYGLSTMATSSIESIRDIVPDCDLMFQIYIHRDRDLTREFVDRCKNAGYKSICLTVDTAMLGNRERELKYGMTMPPRVNRHNFFSYMKNFVYLLNMVRHPDFRLANLYHKVEASAGSYTALFDYVNSQFDRSVTWEDVAWLAQEWSGSFAVKGICSVHDAEMAVDNGASAIILSNHGGRQLDFSPSPLELLPLVRSRLGESVEIVVDGGIRRGSDVVKAMALGATACSIGRPYLYGLAAGGQLGVEHAISLLKEEVERVLTLLGCSNIRNITSEYVSKIR